MLNYKKFILNETAMSSSFNEMRGPRQVGKYIAPFLSKQGLAKTVNAFSNVQTPVSRISTETHGSLHDPNRGYTHKLFSAHESYPAGTPISIDHVFHKDNKIYAKTTEHGDIPINKIEKPKGLKTERRGQYGFDVESRVAKNLGRTKAAGSSNVDKDFEYYHPRDTVEPTVKGSIKTVEPPLSPMVRGESKLEKGRFGVTNIQYKDGKWQFGGHPKMHKIFAKTMVLGPDGVQRPILEHLNSYASDGVVKKGFSASAPKGTARHYINNSDVNALHIHDKSTGNSTTFTVGNELKGKTKLGHMDSSDLDRLDGRITVEPSAPGKARIAHSPNTAAMRHYANLSVTDAEHHRTLENSNHAKEFMGHINSL